MQCNMWSRSSETDKNLYQSSPFWRWTNMHWAKPGTSRGRTSMQQGSLPWESFLNNVNPLTRHIHLKAIFWHFNQFFAFHDPKKTSVLPKSYFLNKRINIPKVRHKWVQTFNLALALLKFFSIILYFYSFESVLLPSSLFAFHIRSGCRKKLGIKCGQSLEMGPWTVIAIMGHFFKNHFCTKLGKLRLRVKG